MILPFQPVNTRLFRQKIVSLFGICVLSACACSCSAQIQQIKSTATEQEVKDLKKAVVGLFPESRILTPGYHPDIREYELIGLTKAQLRGFVKHIPFDGEAQSQFGGEPKLSSDETELTIFQDPDHGADGFELTYKDDRVATVQHHVGGFVGDRLPGFVDGFRPQEGPVLHSRQEAVEYALNEKDWQIHSEYYQDEPVAIAHFYVVAGKIRMERREWKKAKEDFLLAKKQLSKPNGPATNPLPSP